ncbi:hypothetical protein MTO96_045226 [Rhipicephalus appendiculatus]
MVAPSPDCECLYHRARPAFIIACKAYLGIKIRFFGTRVWLYYTTSKRKRSSEGKRLIKCPENVTLAMTCMLETEHVCVFELGAEPGGAGLMNAGFYRRQWAIANASMLVVVHVVSLVVLPETGRLYVVNHSSSKLDSVVSLLKSSQLVSTVTCNQLCRLINPANENILRRSDEREQLLRAAHQGRDVRGGQWGMCKYMFEDSQLR